LGQYGFYAIKCGLLYRSAIKNSSYAAILGLYQRDQAVQAKRMIPLFEAQCSDMVQISLGC
jgi:hypothetical protein